MWVSLSISTLSPLYLSLSLSLSLSLYLSIYLLWTLVFGSHCLSIAAALALDIVVLLAATTDNSYSKTQLYSLHRNKRKNFNYTIYNCDYVLVFKFSAKIEVGLSVKPQPGHVCLTPKVGRFVGYGISRANTQKTSVFVLWVCLASTRKSRWFSLWLNLIFHFFLLFLLLYLWIPQQGRTWSRGLVRWTKYM